MAIVGPTAAGKSELAVRLAERLGGEVVNADAMQLYRGMDIGTAKPTPEQRRQVPHHLLDVWAVSEPASVVAYQRLARRAIDEVLARAAVPILVGGSGLYVRAVLDDLRFPGTDPALRAELEGELARLGAAALHERLAAVDPAAARAILPGNGRRIVRALEVVRLTGRPFAAVLPPPRAVYPCVQLGLDRSPADLDHAIADRVHAMFAAGLVEEVRGLAAAGLRTGPTARRALGYAQVLAHLDGRCGLAEAVEDTVRATRRFARRQRSWFRRDPRIHWLPADARDLGAAALRVVAPGL